MGPTLSRAQRYGSAAGKAGGARLEWSEKKRMEWSIPDQPKQRCRNFLQRLVMGLGGMRNGIAEDERNERRAWPAVC